jgi:hypothetical protein
MRKLLGIPITFLSELSQADNREWKVTFGGFVQAVNCLWSYMLHRLVELLFVYICSAVKN